MYITDHTKYREYIATEYFRQHILSFQQWLRRCANPA
jgi:hypothetical protein